MCLTNLVRCAIEACVSAGTRWSEDDTPLFVIAAEEGSERSLKALLGGVNHALADKLGRTSAHFAAFCGHTY